MPDGIKVEVKGIADLARTFRKAGNEGARDLLLEANREAAARVARTARALAPSRTGRLAGSIRSAGSVKGGIVRAGSAKIQWAGPIHFGWFRRNIKPNPFIFKAMDVEAAKVHEIYMDRLDQLLETVKGA